MMRQAATGRNPRQTNPELELRQAHSFHWNISNEWCASHRKCAPHSNSSSKKILYLLTSCQEQGPLTIINSSNIQINCLQFHEQFLH